MKTKIATIFVIMLATTTMMLAAGETVKIKVYGNCGMCETRIEKAANSINGVTSAEWDKSTQMLAVTMGENTDEMAVHKAVAKVGHDTGKVKADKDVYNGLPGCCKYDRPAHKTGDSEKPCHTKKSKCCDKK